MHLVCANPYPVRRRLWICGSLAAILVATIVLADATRRLSEPSTRWELGGDFVPAYAAGTLLREGRAAEMYEPQVVEQIERQIVSEANLEPLPFYGPYLNPPFFAAVFAPLSALPYRQAAIVWLLFNLICAAGAIVLLCRMLPRDDGWRTWGLVPLLLLISMPFIQALGHLQNTCLSLLLLCLIVSQWRQHPSGSRAAIVAGAFCGLLAYKPQLSAALSLVVVATLGWRAMLGLSATVGSLLALTIWKLPGAITAYLHELPRAVAWIQDRPQYNWGRQITAQGFWRLLIQGHAGGPAHPVVAILSYATMLAGALGLAACVLAYWRRNNSLDGLIAATVASMPLLMPYYMDYDLLLLAVPAVLLAGQLMREDQAQARQTQLLLWIWICLYLLLYVNPGLSGHSRANLAAPMVAVLGAMMMVRFVKRERICESKDRRTYNELLAA
jgi:hypothetical protein